MAELSALSFYLVVLQPDTVFAGLVDGEPADPFMSIGFDSPTVNEGPIAGHTVWFGTSAGGRERGIVRLRDTLPTGTTAGTFSIAETDDVGPAIQDNDTITIKADFRLWPIYPFAIQINDVEAVLYEDYNIAWDNQTVLWKPVSVAGPPAVAFLEGGSAVANFVGDRSFPLAPSATGVAMDYLWTADGSVEGTSAAQGTTGTPVAFTWTAAGQYPVNLAIQDANSVTGTNNTHCFVIDPADPEGVAFIDFDAFNDSFDYEQGGGECSFVVHGDASLDEFPEGSLVIMAARGDLTTPDSGFPFRSNIMFVGYLMGNTIRQNPFSGDVSFRAATIDAVMRNTTTWPMSLTDRKGPKDWTQGSHLNVDRVLSFLWHYRSTLSLMAPIQPCEYMPEIARQDFGPEDLHSNIQGLMANAFGRVVVDHQGVVHHILDHQLMLDTERSAKTTQKTLDKTTWLDNVDVEERADYEWTANVIKQSGVYYPGSEGEVLTFFSEAPGDAPKSFGSESGASSYILDTQANLNVRCGRMLGKDNLRYKTLRSRFLNDGAFTIAPENPFQLNLLAADNDRALTWDPTVLVRRMSREYNNPLGYIRTEVEFEPIATGTASGATVNMPTSPPDPELPKWDFPPPQPWTPPADPNAGPAVAADGTLGHYFTDSGGTTWARRINGLETTQLDFSDLIWDPWWRDKTGGHNPEQAIVWGCGGGFIAKSVDAGKNWQDMTIYLDDPPNSWADSPAPTATDLTYVQIHGCIHNEDTFYAIAEWQNGTSDWRGWLLKTTDDGLTWTWESLGTALPSGYVSGANYTFEFVDDGQQGWYGDAAFAASLGAILPQWEQAASPCQNGVQWVQDTQRSVGGDFAKSIVIRYPDRMTFNSLTAECQRPHKTFLNEFARLSVYISQDGITWTQSGATIGSAAGPLACTTLTEPTYVTGAYVLIDQFTFGQLTGPDDAILTSVLLNTLTIEDGVAGAIRPLRFDVDTQNGKRLYLTTWKDAGVIDLQRRLTSTLELEVTTAFGSSSAAQLAAREAWVAPHCPHKPGVADFGDHVYTFGRWNATGTSRLAYSTDGGVSPSSIEPTDWGTGTTSWIGALETPVALEVLAFLDTASPAELWRTTDHSAWTNLNNLPFDVDPAGVSRHWGTDAELLIANRDATPATGSAAAQLASPYTAAWAAADGANLPKQADGGSGFPAIIWV